MLGKTRFFTALMKGSLEVPPNFGCSAVVYASFPAVIASILFDHAYLLFIHHSATCAVHFVCVTQAKDGNVCVQIARGSSSVAQKILNH